MKTLEQSLEFLFGLQFFGIKLGLENTLRLLSHCDNPQRKYPCIHVAGTNGKGSTCAMLDSIFRAAGYRTGLYTSPHIRRFSERIRVSGSEIQTADIVRWTEKMRPSIEQWRCTFFEATTVMALGYFAEQNVDISIIEVGLGGRLDSTNVVDPEVAAITSIGMDHMEHLGNTPAEIAREKAGIIKKNRPAVIGRMDPDIRRIFADEAAKKKSPVTFLDDDFFADHVRTDAGKTVVNLTAGGHNLRDLEVALPGIHQLGNAAVAIISSMKQSARPVTLEHVRSGLASVRWPARLQTIRERPTVVVDAAHNTSAMHALATAIRSDLRPKYARVYLMMGMLKDKDYESMASIAAREADEVIVVTADGNRALSKEELAAVVRKTNVNVTIGGGISSSYKETLKRMKPDDLLIVTGSHYILSDLFE